MKRRKPLRPGKGPKRSRRQMRQRGNSKYARRERAVDYMLGVKRLGCCAIIVPGHVCEGPIEADHAGSRGMGQKAPDATVIPMCRLAHRQRTDFSGPFRDWDQAQMRDFLVGRIAWTQRAMMSRGFLIPASELAAAPAPRAPVLREPPLAEDLREEGNVDVRHPDAAPLSVARVVSEGAHQ